ncbi:hypothetical protein [Flavobacterium sp.]|uniref:hypothetical protein n=1 Tax=Flavobacterium sp. TaxID=239 RepID=UPI00374D5623
MKKRNSRLFEKFEDSKILADTAKNITAGLMEEPTSADYTRYGGSTDCGDVVGTYPVTEPYKDYVMTSSIFDTQNP